MDDDDRGFEDVMGSAEGRTIVSMLRETGRCGMPFGSREGFALEVAGVLDGEYLPGAGPVRAWVQEMSGAFYVCVELAADG